MTSLTIEINGLKKVENALRNLPPELKKAITDGGMKFMKKVKKSAKLMAPRYSGFLASSIFIDKEKDNIVLSATAKYAAAMETGEGLPHYVSKKKLKNWFGASRTRGVGKVALGSPKGNGGKGMVVVRHYKPFIQPALEKNIAKLQTILSDSSEKGIKEAFK